MSWRVRDLDRTARRAAAGVAAHALAGLCTLLAAPSPALGFELERYSGTWHELARVPIVVQRRCTREVEATYLPIDADTVEVRNRCGTRPGEALEVRGEARVVDAARARLKVTFLPRALRWLPIWADYRVVAIDPDYRLAVVRSGRRAAWVLGRCPWPLDRAALDAILARAGADGLALAPTPQRAPTPACAASAPPLAALAAL